MGLEVRRGQGGKGVRRWMTELRRGRGRGGVMVLYPRDINRNCGFYLGKIRAHISSLILHLTHKDKFT